MTTHASYRAKNAVPLRYLTMANTANSTANTYITFPAPSDPARSWQVMSIAVSITTTGSTTIILYFGASVTQWSFLVGTGGFASPCQRIFSELPVADPGQAIQVRLAADALRTASVVSVTAAEVMS